MEKQLGWGSVLRDLLGRSNSISLDEGILGTSLPALCGEGPE